MILKCVFSKAFLLALLCSFPASYAEQKSVVVYKVSSLSCHGCKHFNASVLPRIKEKFVDTERITLKSIDFVSDLATLIAIKLAYSMGPEKYEEFESILLDRQDEWHVEGQWKEKLRDVALNELSIPEGVVNECFKRETPTEKKILEEQASFIKTYNLTFVPAFIVNDQIIEASVESLEEMLQKEERK
jgi:protein-disulfide isomerase